VDVSATVVVGVLVVLTLWLDSSAPGLAAVEPADSVSAAAIAPLALPMTRPVVSTQIPAAWRRCVEILVSSHQQGTASVGLSVRIVAQFSFSAIAIVRSILRAANREQTRISQDRQ
jgi:hypothetical protein